jgi:hypothetical protein
MKLTFTGEGARGVLVKEPEAALREQIARPAPGLSEAMALVRDFRFRIANRTETNGRPDRCS